MHDILLNSNYPAPVTNIIYAAYRSNSDVGTYKIQYNVRQMCRMFRCPFQVNTI